jgi:cytochrome c oxidase subunit IV
MASGHDAEHSGRPYVLTWLALTVLTAISYAVSHSAELIEIPDPWGMIVALLIAITKATLVALIFMHLLEERFAVRMTLVLSLVFVVLLISLMVGDVSMRTTFPPSPRQVGAAPAATHGE